MILERHYDEEALIAILNSDGGGSRDPHLAGCARCTEQFEAYQAMAEVLGHDEVWNLSDNFDQGADRGAAAIRKFANEMESDEGEAKQLVDELLKLPRQWWLARIERDERYGTSAVLRRLIEVSEAKISTMPAEAVEIAAAAIALGGMLPETDPVLQLSGAAYRQHAFALFYVGNFAKALESVEHAQGILERCTVSEYALARLDVVRSLIYSRQERFDEARALSRAAASVFQAFGDVQRLASARLSEAYLLMQSHNCRDALTIMNDVRQRFWSNVDLGTRALLLGNIGSCRWQLGQIADALQELQVSAELYTELGNEPEAARVRYSVAMLLAAEGKRAEAKKRFDEVIREFQRLGMTQSAVVAGLDLAEIALVENNFEEVEELCRAAIRQFEAAGVPYSSEALTALTYLREAAEQRRATQATVWHVKTYIRRLPDQPALLFAPAPLPPA